MRRGDDGVSRRSVYAEDRVRVVRARGYHAPEDASGLTVPDPTIRSDGGALQGRRGRTLAAGPSA